MIAENRKPEANHQIRIEYSQNTVPTNLEIALGAKITREPWTAETVRQDLPDVRVKTSAQAWGVLTGTAWAPREAIVICIVRGRLQEFATVSVHGYAYPQWQFSWEAIAHSLNSGNPLDGR